MPLDPILTVFASLAAFVVLVGVTGYSAAAYYDSKHPGR